MKVKVLRPFCIGGERKEIGTTLEVEAYLGRELVGMGKASLVEKEEAKKPGPITTDTASSLVKGR